MRLAVERYGDPEGGGFFDRAKDAAPMGGMDIRRKPLQDSPTPGANSVAVIALGSFVIGLTGEKLYREWAEKTLEAFVGLVPQYGLFAATYGLAALLHARHSMQVRGHGRCWGSASRRHLRTRERSFSFRQICLRVTPETLASASLAPAFAKRNSAAPRRDEATGAGVHRDDVLTPRLQIQRSSKNANCVRFVELAPACGHTNCRFDNAVR